MTSRKADKQEKYILLNNDSDLEEFNKSKVSMMHQTQKWKLLSRSQKTKKSSFYDQPQWLCQMFFVLLILICQISLSLFVLKIHQELNILKIEGASAQMKAPSDIASEQEDVATINNRKEQSGSEFKDINQQRTPFMESIISRNTAEQSTPLEKNGAVLEEPSCQEASYLIECVYKLNMSTMPVVHEMKGKIIQLYNYIHNLSDQFLSVDTMVNSRFNTANSQPLQGPVASKMNVFEKRLENVTATLTNLQNRLEEELDDIFLQLHQLKDNFYFLENTLNITQREHLNYHTSTTLSFQEKNKKLNTPGLPFATSSQNYDISAIPETASQAPAEAVDSEILEEKPKITISFIKNLTDLQVLFYSADSDANGYLTSDEIQSLLGEEAPEQEELELFDADDNKVFSYLELMRHLD